MIESMTGHDPAISDSDSGAGGGQLPLDAAQRGSGPFIWRFNLYHRITHAAVIVSFFLLVITGLPLRFSCSFWSEPLIRLLGGVRSAGILHRIGAVITGAYFLAHLGYAAVVVARSPNRRQLLWGRDSIVPHPQDFVDFGRQIRWFLGRGPRPRFGRYSYMEKFDYFAVFWGVAIIGGSGLLLWFPEFFARFLPGWSFNVATVLHADEALLATGFIFTIHFFHVHLKPDKFPLDAVMFTGRATMDYMRHEHGELADQLEERRHEEPTSPAKIDAPAPPPTRRESLVAAALGFLAVAIGFTMIGMILWAVSFC
jgi:cytochrome b subunit of formate dehydrogenase